MIKLSKKFMVFTRQRISDVLPNMIVFNYIIALSYFMMGNRRLPRNLSAQNATVNDYVFHNMIRKSNDIRRKFCVDKEFAKIYATGQCDRIKVAKTVAVFPIDDRTTEQDIRRWLKPFAGQRLVVKPTHSSGIVLFLNHEYENEVKKLLAYAKRNFFKVVRETQYHGLQRKIIIEENISQDVFLDDYKFICIGGRAVFCQVDTDRFGDHKRSYFSIPDFKLVDLTVAGKPVAGQLQAPAVLPEMIRAAEQLARGFKFIRVDLYDTPNGIYFGELTFSPSAGSDRFSNETIAIRLMQMIRQIGPAHHVPT